MVGRGRFDVEIPTLASQQMSLRTLADWVVRPRLLKIPGIAEVFMQGGDRKQYQILVNPTAMLQYDVTLQQIEAALAESNLNTSGGFAVRGETERPIRILGRLGPDARQVKEDLRKIPIKANTDRHVLLEDVASVSEGAQFPRGDGSVNGLPGVVFKWWQHHEAHRGSSPLFSPRPAAFAENSFHGARLHRERDREREDLNRAALSADNENAKRAVRKSQFNTYYSDAHTFFMTVTENSAFRQRRRLSWQGSVERQ